MHNVHKPLPKINNIVNDRDCIRAQEIIYLILQFLEFVIILF